MSERARETQQAAAPTTAPPAREGAAGGATSPLLALQRTAGNAAVLSSIGAPPGDEGVDRLLRSFEQAAGGDLATSPGHGLDGGPVEERTAAAISRATGGGGGGKAMDPRTLQRMESGFGIPLGHVRIHEGGEADRLSRDLNAEAFTVGQDVFLGSRARGDERVLAHELAHTVQQGGGLHRFVSAEQFAEKTYESFFTQRSTAQNRIEKLLGLYAQLSGAQPKGKDRAPVPLASLDRGIDLLDQMKEAAQEWITQHTIEERQQDGSTKVTVDPNRKKRHAGMVWFVGQVDAELVKLNDVKAGLGSRARLIKQEPKLDDKGRQKIKDHYSGGLSTGMGRAAAILGKVVANPGDKTEFELDLQIPVQPGVFVGLIVRFEAEKDDKTTQLQVEALVQAGGSIGIAKLRGALGGYVKAAGTTPEGAMKLVSYGFYRKVAESDLPAEIQSKLWGGSATDFGRKKADEWSKNVEKTELDNDDSFVELGGQAEVGAEVDAGVVEASGSAAYKGGTRYDKKSLEATKGGVGKDNTKSDDWFTQNVASSFGRGRDKTVGRSVHNLELKAGVSGLGGALEGELALNLAWRDDGSGKKTILEETEIELSASGSLPVEGLGGKLVELGASTAMYAKNKAKKLLDDADAQAAKQDTSWKPGMAEVSLAKNAAETGFLGVKGLPFSDWAKAAVTGGEATPSGGEEESLTNSSVGLELYVNWARQNDGSAVSYSGRLELRHVKGMDAEIPELLAVKLRRKTRIGGAAYDGGAWKALW